MMEKDSVANVVSFAGLGAALMNWQSILTIALLCTGIVLNALRIREHYKKMN